MLSVDDLGSESERLGDPPKLPPLVVRRHFASETLGRAS